MLQATSESWRALIEGPASVDWGSMSVDGVRGDVDVDDPDSSVGVEGDVDEDVDVDAEEVVGVGHVRSGSRGCAGVMRDRVGDEERIRQRKVNGCGWEEEGSEST
jgi:hypothetical protein